MNKGSVFSLFRSPASTKTRKFGVRYRVENFRSEHCAFVDFSRRLSSGGVLGSSSQAIGLRSKVMAASNSTATSGDLVVDSIISSCGSGSRIGISSSVYFSNRTLGACQKAGLSFRNGDSKSGHLVGGCSILGAPGRLGTMSPLGGSLLKTHVNLSSRSYSTDAVPDVSHGGFVSEEQLTSLAISGDEKNSDDGKLKLLSGSCYLPHPDKEATGGEDAHFICEDEQIIGVADGVGGWADIGVNAGDYSRELMSNSVHAIRGLPERPINPAQVLEKAHARTGAMGSSTACIILLEDQGLHAVNLGDSGFIVVRDGCTIFESTVQQHGFNFPYQLERGDRADVPSSAQVYKVPISAGDVIVAGTDGLFDNLYNHEINAIVANGLAAGLSPAETAQKIAALARERGHDTKQQTPFSAAAQQSGFTYYGGKLDDVTVVVAYITA